MDAQRLFKSSLTRNERVAAQACDFCGLGPIYFRAASWAAAEPGNFARILEKQNRLQMSQVFPFSCIDDQMGVVFQGFYKRAASPKRCCFHVALLTVSPKISRAK